MAASEISYQEVAERDVADDYATNHMYRGNPDWDAELEAEYQQAVHTLLGDLQWRGRVQMDAEWLQQDPEGRALALGADRKVTGM